MGRQNSILSSTSEENLEYHIMEEHMACIIRLEATSALKMEAVNFSMTSVSTYCRGAQVFKKI
jgi:hypothetical protein